MLLKVPSWVDVAPVASELRELLNTIRNKISHLRRSHAELEEALLESPGDKDFEDAIVGNEC